LVYVTGGLSGEEGKDERERDVDADGNREDGEDEK
jgi:hypothetical protein